MTQGELAASIDIDSSYISKIEHNTRALTADVVTQLSLRHQVPTTFFTAEDPIRNSAAPTYRKKANTPLRESRYVEVLQKLAMRLFHHVSIASDYVTWQNPVPDDIEDPEEAAIHARVFFGVSSSEPIRNVTRLLERNGAGVIRDLSPHIDRDLTNRYHGITRPDPMDDRPLVALFDTGRGDVNRFTTAHELGHLIFDRREGEVPSKAREDRAFRFAGAFLFPENIAREWIRPDLPLSGYLAIKAQYGISASAAIRRGKDLGIIDQDRYRSLMIQHSTRGWRSNEPGHVEPESPALLSQALFRAWPDHPVRSAVIASGVPSRAIIHWTGAVEQDPFDQSDQAPANVIDLAAARSRRNA